MKTELYTNVSLVRIPVKAGVMEYHLPQNVEWANRQIDKLLIVAPPVACIDPVDGQTPVLTSADIDNLYVELYDSNDRELMHDVSAEQLLHLNNQPLRVDAALNLALCRVYFTQAPVADGTLLMYAFYGTRTEDYYDLSKKSVTVEFPMAANEQMTLQEVINTYAHALPAKIQGIICWNAPSNPAYLALRDYKLTYQMANVHTELCRPDAAASYAYDTQAALFLLNDLDINFDYSYIRNAQNAACTQKITFLFS